MCLQRWRALTVSGPALGDCKERIKTCRELLMLAEKRDGFNEAMMVARKARLLPSMSDAFRREIRALIRTAFVAEVRYQRTGTERARPTCACTVGGMSDGTRTPADQMPSAKQQYLPSPAPATSSCNSVSDLDAVPLANVGIYLSNTCGRLCYGSTTHSPTAAVKNESGLREGSAARRIVRVTKRAAKSTVKLLKLALVWMVLWFCHCKLKAAHTKALTTTSVESINEKSLIRRCASEVHGGVPAHHQAASRTHYWVTSNAISRSPILHFAGTPTYAEIVRRTPQCH